ncbi:MAG: lysine--tRNA ligase [Candidatus Hydrogenedentes bacterium]|nr:lysine--tRNA ligase [Candidatus Hydrogenedentota bacterium]
MDTEQHHSTEQDLIQNRIEKAERIRARGDEPYKYRFERSCTIGEARAAFEREEAGGTDAEQIDVRATLAGRIVAYRDQGKVAFADLRDQTAGIQLFLRMNTLGDEAYAQLKDLDIGDFIGVEGAVFRTRRGEVSVRVESYVILTKSLRPLPEKYHGLTDVETRYRRRYLDMVANPEVLEVFRKRVRIIDAMRTWLTGRGFLEVETPMLHPIPGGATARPFITHHNTYDRDFYLRVAPELYLKRLIVGGFERVFEINRNFRNEGVDTQHNPEFTMMELYEAYQDYLGLMDETEELLVAAIEQATGGLEFTYQGEPIHATRPWKRLKLYDAIREYAGIDLERTRDRAEAARLAEGIGVEVDAAMGYGKIVDEVMSERVQPHLVQPTFLYDYPIEISPLAKKKRDNPALTERYQVFIGRLELCNAFSELNDPVDQRERFMDQLRQREQGDEEAQRLDDDFITALEVGMPPTAGLGIGIDRLAMLLTDSASIREVILFPQLRTVE